MKYGPGEPITTMAEMDAAIESGSLLWMKLWERTVLPRDFVGMTYGTVKNYVLNGRVFIAKEIEQPKEAQDGGR